MHDRWGKGMELGEEVFGGATPEGEENMLIDALMMPIVERAGNAIDKERAGGERHGRRAVPLVVPGAGKGDLEDDVGGIAAFEGVVLVGGVPKLMTRPAEKQQRFVVEVETWGGGVAVRSGGRASQGGRHITFVQENAWLSNDIGALT